MRESSELQLETIRVDRPAAGIVVATLDRPERMNAMTMAMFAEIERLAVILDREDGLRVLIVTGAGDRAFCAGYDLDDAAGLSELPPMEMLDRQEHAARALSALRSIRVPVIAMATLICANSPAGVQLSKRALHANMEITSYAAALELEDRGQALLTRGEDMTEALAAFRDKRAPKFTGR